MPNPKLAYEANEPAFLQKLRGQHGNSTGRLERPAQRPQRLKKDDDDDDEPTYVDEESNEVITKEEYKVMVQESNPDDDPSTKDGEKEAKEARPAESAPKQQSNLTEIGTQKKRKQAKVVGDDQVEPEQTQPKAPVSRKPKKAKKIKLSFDEE
ncbi:uncharacterized protein PFLUO_LOCUS5088 [Penicillium psychrofluorescens]|uniref:uncharacterized protein n=1 Tax=Penicillium psychrofluorescens TaxID=3158075 RepID=UPI003CCD4FFB